MPHFFMFNYSAGVYGLFRRLFLLDEFSAVHLCLFSPILIGIVGLGGIGFPLSPYLVDSGIPLLLLLDGDIVVGSILDRPILFYFYDIGVV
jgi:Dinucleotide-utilizing enzymes involved in molybdopterin and thiamine biosynthesis family 2